MVILVIAIIFFFLLAQHSIRYTYVCEGAASPYASAYITNGKKKQGTIIYKRFGPAALGIRFYTTFSKLSTCTLQNPATPLYICIYMYKYDSFVGDDGFLQQKQNFSLLGNTDGVALFK